MDIMLERVLSLVPKKHGGKKDFALSIGFKSGEIVSDWIAGRSQSYKNYIYEISQKYNVTPEWLKGETDEKHVPADPFGGDADALEVFSWYKELSEEQQKNIADTIKLYRQLNESNEKR